MNCSKEDIISTITELVSSSHLDRISISKADAQSIVDLLNLEIYERHITPENAVVVKLDRNYYTPASTKNVFEHIKNIFPDNRVVITLGADLDVE